MAKTSKMVSCVNEECELYDVVYEIPYAMLTSEEEPVNCGACMEEAPEVLARASARKPANMEPVNADQVTKVKALNRKNFVGSHKPLPT